MIPLPDRELAEKRMSELYRHNIDQFTADDVIIASCGGAGQSYLGNILFELGLNYVDAYTEKLRTDGFADGLDAHSGYRNHLASLHERDSAGERRGVRPWPRFVKCHHPPEVITTYVLSRVWLLVRDPRDALYSLYQWRHNYAEEAWDQVPETFGDWLRGPGDFTAGPVDDWSAFHTAWPARAGSRMSVIRFEDLKQNPFEVMTEALRPLRVPFAPERLREAIGESSFEKMRAHENAVAGAEEPRMIRVGRVAGWRNWMTAELARYFAGAELREVAGRFGYDMAAA